MSDKYGATEMVIPSTTSKPSFGTRVKNHFRRFWWAHLIAFIVIVLVIVLPGLCRYPNIAQDDVNDSTLEVKSISITDPTPDSFHLNQTQVLGTDSMFHPHFYEFNATARLSGSKKPFTVVQIPPMKANDGTVINVDQDVDLEGDAFGDFSTAIMLNKEVDMNLFGRPRLKQGALPKIGVVYNKTVTIKGLNKLEGFNVTNYHITVDPDPFGNSMNGTVSIPNPSVLTITMVSRSPPPFPCLTQSSGPQSNANKGNLTMDLSVDGTHVGQAFLNDFVMRPGENKFDMTAKVNNTVVMDMIGDKYTKGIVPFDITGNSSIYNGKELPYFSKALKANTLKVELNILEGLKGV
ncbi:hypothetical protein PHISCL_05481 [Aspergillus sclerotialis]|uniref:Uncharacterized protein n=1 Tax=Aspergillus sclerotialis TaxID=2070753 RepID=A0A3A2ZW28_9EURO|nr:hypothetical protein PHISCL_05481 [Aspergillus sclerotialis]